MNVLHPMSQHDADFKDQRKFMKEVLAPDVLRRHEALLDEEGRRMLCATFERPEQAPRHMRRCVWPFFGPSVIHADLKDSISSSSLQTPFLRPGVYVMLESAGRRSR